MQFRRERICRPLPRECEHQGRARNGPEKHNLLYCLECYRSRPDQLHDAPCPILVRRYSPETHRARDVVPATGTRGSRPPFVRIVALGTQPSQRSEEHTSELQSLMRISYAVFCLKKTKQPKQINTYKTKTQTQ